jgi:hypothetical protein
MPCAATFWRGGNCTLTICRCRCWLREPAKPRPGDLWTYVRDARPAGDPSPPAVSFAYSPDRKGEHPQHHLRDFRGALQADAFAGFNAIYEDPTRGIREAAGISHIRRKFYDLHRAHASPVATEVLRRIGALYEIESEIRGRTPQERPADRRRSSAASPANARAHTSRRRRPPASVTVWRARTPARALGQAPNRVVNTVHARRLPFNNPASCSVFVSINHLPSRGTAQVGITPGLANGRAIVHRAWDLIALLSHRHQQSRLDRVVTPRRPSGTCHGWSRVSGRSNT